MLVIKRCPLNQAQEFQIEVQLTDIFRNPLLSQLIHLQKYKRIVYGPLLEIDSIANCIELERGVYQPSQATQHW